MFYVLVPPLVTENWGGFREIGKLFHWEGSVELNESTCLLFQRTQFELQVPPQSSYCDEWWERLGLNVFLVSVQLFQQMLETHESVNTPWIFADASVYLKFLPWSPKRAAVPWTSRWSWRKGWQAVCLSVRQPVIRTHRIPSHRPVEAAKFQPQNLLNVFHLVLYVKPTLARHQ